MARVVSLSDSRIGGMPISRRDWMLLAHYLAGMVVVPLVVRSSDIAVTLKDMVLVLGLAALSAAFVTLVWVADAPGASARRRHPAR